jgi:hypothetical protein
MSWGEDQDNKRTITIDGRKLGEPHPDAQANYERAFGVLRCCELSTGMQYEIHDRIRSSILNADGSYESVYEVKDPKYLLFLWKTLDNERMTYSISFHQMRQKFNQEFDEWINLLQKRFALKRLGFLKPAMGTGTEMPQEGTYEAQAELEWWDR